MRIMGHFLDDEGCMSAKCDTLSLMAWALGGQIWIIRTLVSIRYRYCPLHCPPCVTMTPLTVRLEDMCFFFEYSFSSHFIWLKWPLRRRTPSILLGLTLLCTDTLFYLENSLIDCSRYHNVYFFLEIENKNQDVSHRCPQPKLPTIE